MSLILRTPWTWQPQVAGASVDRERLGALGVCGGFVAIPGKWPPRNIVNATDPIPSAGALGVNVGMVPTTDIKGIAGNWFADGSNRYLRYTLGAPSATNFSFAARLRITDAANIIPVRSSDTADGTTIAVWNNGGAFDMRINGTDYSAAGSFSLNSWYDIQIVGSGSACRLYVDGNLTINGAAASAGTLDANFCLGATSGGASTAPNGSVDILYCVWANRAWNDGEREGVRNNPWQLFAPRRIWVPVSVSGGGTTVSVPAGSLTITGNDPTVLTPRTIAVPKGELTLTGNAPTVSTPIVVSVPVGSLSLTGFAPTVVTPRTIPVPAGTLSLTGFAPTVTAGGGQIVQVPAGSIVLTGYAPVVVAPRTISVPAGSLAITGYAPTVLNSTIVSIPAGSLTLTGFAPSVVATANKYISVPSGTLTLTGYAPTVSSGSLTIYFWKRTA